MNELTLWLKFLRLKQKSLWSEMWIEPNIYEYDTKKLEYICFWVKNTCIYKSFLFQKYKILPFVTAGGRKCIKDTNRNNFGNLFSSR